MIRHSIDRDRGCIGTSNDSAEVFEKARFDFSGDQRLSPFGRENEVTIFVM